MKKMTSRTVMWGAQHFLGCVGVCEYYTPEYQPGHYSDYVGAVIKFENDIRYTRKNIIWIWNDCGVLKVTDECTARSMTEYYNGIEIGNIVIHNIDIKHTNDLYESEYYEVEYEELSPVKPTDDDDDLY